MSHTRKILNIVSFIFTAFLLIYGFAKGYDLIELVTYNLYFISQIITQLLNLLDYRKENE